MVSDRHRDEINIRDKILTFEQARIKVNERAVVIIDHPDRGPVKTKEIRLAPESN